MESYNVEQGQTLATKCEEVFYDMPYHRLSDPKEYDDTNLC